MIPKISVKKRSNVGPALFGTSSALMMTLDVALGAFAVGFTLMMTLDVALGA